MFDFIHKHNRLIQIILGLLIVPPFAFWGIQSYDRGTISASDVASVGGIKISQQEFATELRKQEDRMRSLFGGRVDPAAFDTPQARERVLDGMISQRLLTRDAVRRHLSATNNLLREMIASTPAFQENGKFSDARYKQLLEAEGLSPLQFEASLRRDLMVQQLATALGNANIVARAVARQWALIAGERREISEASIPAAHFAAQVKVTPEEAKAFYEANKSRYAVPERAHVQYVVLSTDALAAQVKITPEEIKAQYQAHLSQYEQKEERDASHILIAVKPDASKAERQKAKAKAEAIAAQVKKNPASFAEVAKKESQDPGSASKGGDLGFFSRGMMVKQFEDQVFRMKVGQIVGPVKSDFGYHIIRLNAIRPGKVQPLAQVRGDIERAIRKQRASRKFDEAAENFSNIVYEQPDSLEPAAEKYKIPVQDGGWVTRKQAKVKPLDHPKMLAAIFAADAIKDHHNTEAIEVSPGTLVSARVLEYKPASVRTFEEVRAEVEREMLRKRAAERAWKEGAAKLAQLKRGDPAGLDFDAPRTLGREGAKGVPPDEISAAFRVATSKLPAYAGIERPDGYAIVRVSKVVPPALDEAKETNTQTALARELGAAQFDAYVAALRADTKIKINQALLQKKEE